MTSTTRPVVVGLDWSRESAAAVDYAVDMASRRCLALRFVHVLEPNRGEAWSTMGWVPQVEGLLDSDLIHDAEELVQHTLDRVQAAAPDLTVAGEVVTGSASGILLDEAERASAVVVGSKGMGGFVGMLLGSTTLHLAARVKVPLVAVPVPAEGDEPRELSGVVVGVDGSELSLAAVQYAFEAASGLGQKLIAIHTWQEPPYSDPSAMTPLVYDVEQVEQDEQIVLAESLSGWAERFPDVEVEQRVVRGHPVRVLVDAAQDAHLLIVGSRGRGAVARLLGSVSLGVLHHAKVPIAVVHQPKPEGSRM